ncbi:HNH endonuclease, partial [Mycobacterium sp. MYCO198283]|uniref:HNH endonuclease n=1 Tax=Mycobacterium sp. MYCO198283 TaxID=2883505 RepID=UPI001E614C32
TGWGDRRVAAEAKKIAYRLDPHAVVDRAANAPADRCVTLRPAPDTMTYLTALLPVTQGVAVYAALKRAADITYDHRSRGQIMADTLVERLTGRPADAPVPVAVNLVVSDDTLLGGSDQPAHVTDYGPVPAAIACRLVDAAVRDPRSAATLRRLYAAPATGQLVKLDARTRTFPKGLADFIDLRDQRCRTPYCDAPIRHHDHITAHHRGGTTSAANGQGLCEHCNYTKEAPGWRTHPDTDDDGRHLTIVRTPTGARYRSTAPPLPGWTVSTSWIETRIGVEILRHAA